MNSAGCDESDDRGCPDCGALLATYFGNDEWCVVCDDAIDQMEDQFQ